MLCYSSYSLSCNVFSYILIDIVCNITPESCERFSKLIKDYVLDRDSTPPEILRNIRPRTLCSLSDWNHSHLRKMNQGAAITNNIRQHSDIIALCSRDLIIRFDESCVNVWCIFFHCRRSKSLRWTFQAECDMHILCSLGHGNWKKRMGWLVSWGWRWMHRMTAVAATFRCT